MWLKLPAETPATKDLYIALTYCRTSNYQNEVTEFYARLAHDSLMYRELGEVFVMGDFNARLGEYTGDRAPGGKWAINGNASAFLSFQEATELVLLNRKHAYGTPTFSRPGAASNSIIDFILVSPHIEEKCSEFQVQVLDTGHYHYRITESDLMDRNPRRTLSSWNC